MIKKNFNFSLKKFNLRLIFTSFLAVSLLVYSCQKENTPNFTASKANLMAEARSFFENDVAPLPRAIAKTTSVTKLHFGSRQPW
jgi:hypothetical protein